MWSYDDVPYPTAAWQTSSIRAIQTVGLLLGLEPASANKARVLELGCGNGMNLLPQAQMYPDADFVGCDLCQTAIEFGQELAKQIGADNIALRHANIDSLNHEWGEFDYIICHGVYSWVPEQIQARILNICRQQLTPQGIAFVSYNVLPGWFLRKPFRDLTKWHASRFDKSTDAVPEALSVLAMVAEVQDGKEDAYSILVRDEYYMLSNSSDGYLCHEMLEAENSPCYFSDFNRAANSAGLQFLSEAEIHQMDYSQLPDVPRSFLDNQSLVDREQYLDYFTNRMFRQTLLCHDVVTIDRSLTPQSPKSLYVRATNQPSGCESDQATPTHQQFDKTPSVRDALAIRVTDLLNERWPDMIRIDELAQASDSPSPGPLWHFLREQLLCKRIQITADVPRFVTAVGQYPHVTPLVRTMASRGNVVPNQFHAAIGLTPTGRLICQHLDGKHDRSSLISIVDRQLQADTLPRLPSESNCAAQLVDQTLETLRQDCLLVN